MTDDTELLGTNPVDERDALRRRLERVARLVVEGDETQHERFLKLIVEYGRAVRTVHAMHYERLIAELEFLSAARDFARNVVRGTRDE